MERKLLCRRSILSFIGLAGAISAFRTMPTHKQVTKLPRQLPRRLEQQPGQQAAEQVV
jgi:hypothetical protein